MANLPAEAKLYPKEIIFPFGMGNEINAILQLGR
jgi:hypothetical protein